VGETTAEDIKIQIGNAVITDEQKKAGAIQKMDIRGRDTITGLPRSIELDEIQINEAIKATLMDIVGGAKEVLEKCPPELASDIIDKGIVMSGGTSLLKNLDLIEFYGPGKPGNCIASANIHFLNSTSFLLFISDHSISYLNLNVLSSRLSHQEIKWQTKLKKDLKYQ
jgi:rod shape-determining protein MreB